MKSLLIAIVFAFIGLPGTTIKTIAQSVIATDGGSASGGGIHLDYTLGELAVDGLTGQQNSMTEGFHQPFLQIENVESNPSGKEQPTGDKSESMIALTPNPVQSALTVRFAPGAPESVALDVRDASGMLVLQKQLQPLNGDTSLDVSGFPSGVFYFQFVSADQRIQSTYKISKIQ